MVERLKGCTSRKLLERNFFPSRLNIGPQRTLVKKLPIYIIKSHKYNGSGHTPFLHRSLFRVSWNKNKEMAIQVGPASLYRCQSNQWFINRRMSERGVDRTRQQEGGDHSGCTDGNQCEATLQRCDRIDRNLASIRQSSIYDEESKSERGTTIGRTDR